MESTLGRVLDTVGSYRNDILEFAEELVALQTENPPGRAYQQCIDVIGSKLHEIGLDYALIEVPRKVSRIGDKAVESDFGYCLLSYFGYGKRVLYFHGHYDVVPASNESQFRPYVEDGRLGGRGSSDMKGGLAAMIYAVRAIEACGMELDGRIGLMIVPDEETGGLQGSQHLAKVGLLGKDAIGMITPEPTGGLIWNANRGAISLLVTVKGTPAHVGLHFQGVNAFERVLVVAKRLQEINAEVESRRTEFKIQPEAAQRSILLMGGRCEGGTSFNVAPGECAFTIDRRINPEEDFETERRRLLSVLEELRQNGIGLEVEILQEGKSSGFSEDNPLAQALASSVEQITGKRPAFELCLGLLETRFYAERGIPSFAYGPGLLSVSHEPNEFVKVDDICTCAKAYALTAARLLE